MTHVELEELTGSYHTMTVMCLKMFKIGLDINNDKEITH